MRNFLLALVGAIALVGSCLYIGLHGAQFSKPAAETLKPLAILSVKDCGKLLGVLVITDDGAIHNMPGPFSPDVIDGIKALAKQVPNQKQGLASVDMPCHADGDKSPEHHEGETNS